MFVFTNIVGPIEENNPKKTSDKHDNLDKSRQVSKSTLRPTVFETTPKTTTTITTTQRPETTTTLATVDKNKAKKLANQTAKDERFPKGNLYLIFDTNLSPIGIIELVLK